MQYRSCRADDGDLKLSVSAILPDAGGAMLSSIGLGQGAYLLKKAALSLGKG